MLFFSQRLWMFNSKNLVIKLDYSMLGGEAILPLPPLPAICRNVLRRRTLDGKQNPIHPAGTSPVTQSKPGCFGPDAGLAFSKLWATLFGSSTKIAQLEKA